MSDEATSIAVALRRRGVAQAGRTPGGDGERGTDLAGRVRAAGDHGTPQSTRAAEGAAALVAASALSNLAAKPLVGRRRPIAIPRRTTPKQTLSFPSSHATTSFAYATAVTARWPAGGVPLLVAAGAIAGSRVHTRHHRISDVLAGALLGASVGALVHRVSDRALGSDAGSADRRVPGPGV